ncbi:peptidoglycan-binding protein LysM [Celeribacter naphthalenivorans]|uniref:peptidoglycan-binding protein LysM n=1 Tax=Celeribacter naphthalenivorans TaxID=1614694 RepID=UPI001CFA32C7|nr:peptidoglycan-binding protein LysM [Celeribacter naphthalenivorans]
MGLFSFVKDAGKKVFGKKEEEADADAILAEIKALGLEAEGIEVAMDGDKVVLGGTVTDQVTKEKIIMAAGNVAGVAAVEDTLAGADPVFHEVKKGDTLWAVAKNALGDGNRYMEIFEANKPMLSDPDKIYPGQMLIIPQG